MLFTRCPACDTTFRVTDEALTKAGGQVRCGRCANVFNAYAELRETVSPPATTQAVAAPASAPTKAVAASAPSPAVVLSMTAMAPAPVTTPAAMAATGDKARTQMPREEEPFDELSVAAVVAQVKLADDESEQDEISRGNFDAAREPGALSVEQVQHVLEKPAASETTAIWELENRPPATRSNRWWRVGAALAMLALVVQGVHHFRSDLAGQKLIGPWVQQAYGMFGTPLAPRWDITQYQILDWVATAEPNARGQGNLQITARIHNRGPQPQPYPRIHLQLKDRWEETVASRIFDPSEYLGANATASDLMRPGNTVQAQIDVVDPGPDAYGFELDVCVEVETGVVTCGNDEVFL